MAKIFSYKFPFGIYDSDDIYQEAFIIATEALSTYDNVRPLSSYLFTVLYTRLINLKRNKFYRSELPCNSCPFFDGACTLFSSQQDCPILSDHLRRNEAKRSLSSSFEVPSDLSTMDNSIHLFEYPPHLRDLILRASSGEKLAKQEKEQLRSYLEDHDL